MVTDAIRHGDGPIQVRIAYESGDLRVEVRDDGNSAGPDHLLRMSRSQTEMSHEHTAVHAGQMMTVGQTIPARLMTVFPAWLVVWGSYSREFWAFPCFDVPRGMFLHAADANELAGMMRQVQRSVWGER